MQNLKYFIIILLITSCSMPSKESLYRENLDKTINKDLEGYGIMIVKFEKITINRGGDVKIYPFGNVKICNYKNDKCINLSMYTEFMGLISDSYAPSISGKYYAFKLKADDYYIKSIINGVDVDTLKSKWHFIFNSKPKISIKENKVIYIGDISLEHSRTSNPFNLNIKQKFIIKNNFKEAIETIKKENPLLDISNAEVNLLKINE